MKPEDVVILGFRRTPFCEWVGSKADGEGGPAGKFAGFSAPQLGACAARAVLQATGIDQSRIGHIVFGLAEQNHVDDFYGARGIGLEMGMEDIPALTVARICGSGAQAVVTAAQMLMTGDAHIILAGGMESMSGSPHVIRGLRKGPVGLMQPPQVEDLFSAHLFDRFAATGMGGTANNLAAKHGVTREDCDAFACRSQGLASESRTAGYFASEICPVTVKTRSGSIVIEQDDHIRPGTTIDQLARLPGVKAFQSSGTEVITAGNASGMVDGAAAFVLTTAEYARALECPPIGRLVNWGYAGCDPSIMGFGPVPATRNALARANLTIDDLSVFELNEAFAPVAIVGMRELGVREDIFNPHGGAIALGHPLGATGARLIGTVLNHLRTEKKGSLGAATMCIGGGQGICVIVEAL